MTIHNRLKHAEKSLRDLLEWAEQNQALAASRVETAQQSGDDVAERIFDHLNRTWQGVIAKLKEAQPKGDTDDA